jgi:hypothetical protein
MPLTVAVGESASELLLRVTAMVSGDRYAVATLMFLSVIVYRFFELHVIGDLLCIFRGVLELSRTQQSIERETSRGRRRTVCTLDVRPNATAAKRPVSWLLLAQTSNGAHPHDDYILAL